MKYIDADKLRAEIERRYNTYKIGAHSAFRNGKIEALREVLELSKSLQQEQPGLPGIEEAAELDSQMFGEGMAGILSDYKTPEDDTEALGDYEWHIAKYFYNLGKQAGAEWMAGQFQKIEGDLVDWYSTSDDKDYCCGIKTDESFEIPEGFYIRKKQ